MNTPREVFGYCRVSSKGQVDGDGFPRQREAILKFCESKGWTCKRIFEEKAVSGDTEMENREAFMEMLGLCGGVLPTTIIVERADRVARKLITAELLYRECATAGVEIFAADSGQEMVLADVDPTRTLIRQVLGAFAEWNKNELVLKLRKARNRKRVQTGRCEGAKPFSMTNPESYGTVITWIVGARDRGESYNSIAKQLNSLGHKSPKGGRWGSSLVFKFYQNHQKELCTT